MPPKRRAYEAIDLTGDDDAPAYSSSPHRAPKQARTSYNQAQRITSGSSQADAIFIDEDDEDDASQEVPDATQAYNQQQYDYILYGIKDDKVVGLRFYNGYATNGEMVVLSREPHNRFDSNAIKVSNVQGAQIGHLPRGPASKLAKYMDERSLLIEAQLTGEKGEYDCPMQLKLYGTNDPAVRQQLMTRMRRDGLPIGHASDQQRKEAAAAKAAAKERERIAKQAAKEAKKKGAAVVGVAGSQAPESSMGEFAASSSQGPGLVPGPSMEDIIGGSLRFNPRNVEEMVEEYGVKEEDLVSDAHVQLQYLPLTFGRRKCHKRPNPTLFLLSCTPSSYKACNGCSTRKAPDYQHRTPKKWSSYGDDTLATRTPSRT